MAKVELKHDYEKFESLLRRFKKACDRDDLLKEMRKREAFEKPTTERKRAKAAAKKRWQKKLGTLNPTRPINRR